VQLRKKSRRPSAVIWCLRRCVCLTFVAVASKKAQ